MVQPGHELENFAAPVGRNTLGEIPVAGDIADPAHHLVDGAGEALGHEPGHSHAHEEDGHQVELEVARGQLFLGGQRFLHPLLGGKDGKGWEFGRPVLKSDLVHHIEEIPGVDGVDSIDMRDELKDVTVEHVRIDDELPFLINVTIAEKVRDDIR